MIVNNSPKYVNELIEIIEKIIANNSPWVCWCLASSDIGGLPDITAPDIGDLRISQYPYSDIGVTDIGELRYHSTTTPISEYQSEYSDVQVDSDIRVGGAVISEV